MNGLRIEFQDRVNFVILDWDKRSTDRAFAGTLGLTTHPSFGAVTANSDDVTRGLYAAPRRGELREIVEELLADHEG